jgi:hypothetical protein
MWCGYLATGGPHAICITSYCSSYSSSMGWCSLEKVYCPATWDSWASEDDNACRATLRWWS